jgi:hypothetical protein
MNTGQVLLSILAFVFLSTVMVNFHSLVADNTDQMTDSHDVIIATSISSSYLETAQAMNFDEKSIDTPVNDPGGLTEPGKLGPDKELNIAGFDDFDDFNGLDTTVDAGAGNGVYRSVFQVCYVDPEDINTVASQTFLKRLDIKTWRADRPVTTDTVCVFTTMGYFRFN